VLQNSHLRDASTSPRSNRSCDLLSTMLANMPRRLRGTASSPRCSKYKQADTKHISQEDKAEEDLVAW
jgi:hypothetical protein